MLRDHPTRVALVAIFVLAVALRAVVYLQATHPYDGAGLVAEQGEMAHNIATQGRWFEVNRHAAHVINDRQNRERRLIDVSEFDMRKLDRVGTYQPEIHQMPGVAVVLAAFWSVLPNENYAPLQWLQILLDASAALVVYWIATRLTRDRRVALFAAFLYAVWPGAIVVAKRPMLDTWAGFFTIWCTALYVWARAAPRRTSRLVLLGAVTGVGIYFRPFLFLLPIALALAAAPKQLNLAGRLRWIGVPAGVALLVLSPWTIRNYFEFHKFIPTRSGLGYALYEGMGRASSDAEATKAVRQNDPKLKPLSPDSDKALVKKSFHSIVHDPIGYLHGVAPRFRFLLPCLLLLVVWRRWKTEALLLIAVALATILPYVPIGSDTRFYLPAAFAYLVLGAMAVSVIVSSGASKLQSLRSRHTDLTSAG